MDVVYTGYNDNRAVTRTAMLRTIPALEETCKPVRTLFHGVNNAVHGDARSRK